MKKKQSQQQTGWPVFYVSTTLRRGQVPSVERATPEHTLGRGVYVMRTHRAAKALQGGQVHMFVLSQYATLAPHQLWTRTVDDQRAVEPIARTRLAQRALLELGFDGAVGPLGPDDACDLCVWRDGLLSLDKRALGGTAA